MGGEEGGITTLIEKVFDRKILDVHTAFPGEIIEYQASTNLAVVQPLIKFKYKDESLPEEVSKLYDVCVVHPRTSAGMIKLPIASGDIVTVLCSDRSLDNWLAGKGQAVFPDTARHHSLSDAYCFLGGYPSLSPWKGETNEKALEIRVASGTPITLGNETVELLKLINDLITHLLAGVATAVGPGNLIKSAEISALQLQLQQLVAK